MKILNVIMCLDQYTGGGAVNRVVELSQHLSKKKHDCTILTTKSGLKNKYRLFLKNKKIKIVALDYISNKYKYPLKIFSWLKKNANSYDAVHLCLNWTPIVALCYLYLKFNKIPYFFSAMGWLKIDGASKILKFFFKLFFTIPIVKNAKACIAITKYEYEQYLNIGISKKKIILIPNGISKDFFSQKISKNYFKIKNKIDDRPIILFIGRIDPVKGPDILINAFAKVSKIFKNYQLIICGNDNNYLATLKKIVNELNLQNKVTFLGPVINNEKISAYKASNLMVIPSRFDTMTIVSLEAGISGLPFLISNESNFPKIKSNHGIFFEDADEDKLAKKIISILKLKNFPTIYKKKVFNFINSNFNWNIIGNLFIKTFKK